jgi:hyperosmotically inducible protein
MQAPRRITFIMKQKTIYALALAAAVLATGAPLCASESDETISSSFSQSYVYRTYLKNEAVRAEAQEGVVRLTGTVSEEFHKALAQEMVASLPAVIRVDNRLEITGEIPAENSDEWIRKKVQNMLALHRSVSPRVEVDVTKGLVVLRGTAMSQNQIDLTARYAQAVEGVTEVRNEMTVDVPPGNFHESINEQIDDASITALVKLTLQYHDRVCALANEVKTRSGIVLLSGKARDTVGQDRAAALLIDIHGVQSVVDTHNGIAAYGYFEEPRHEASLSIDRMAENDVIVPSLPGLSLPIADRD